VQVKFSLYSWLSLVCLAASLALSGCSSSHPNPTRATVSHRASTRVLPRYTPFSAGGSLNVGMTIRRSLSGTCNARGPVLPGTYLCSTAAGHHHNIEVGLCYPEPNATELMCVNGPMAKTAVRFRSTTALPPPTTSPPKPPPTQLQLSDGTECGSTQAFGPQGKRFNQGVLGHDGSLSITYECDGPFSAIFGPINETTSPWTVKARTTVTQGPLREVTVKRAWL
jgi:hypothetical protein